MKDLSPWRNRQLVKTEDIQPQYNYASEPDDVPLAYYWNVLLKRRNIILPIFLVVFAAGTYFALSATTIYTAAATIKIEPNNPQVTGLGDLQALDSRTEYDYYQTQFSLLSSRPLAARVIAELGLESNKTFTNAHIVSPNPIDHIRSWIFRVLGYFSYYLGPLFKSAPETDGSKAINAIADDSAGDLELRIAPSLLERYLGFVSIAPIKKTQLVAVQFTTPDPALSQALANAHVQSFLRMSLERRFSLTKEAQGFLDQKKVELRQKLEKSEAALNQFRRAHGVVSVEKGENIVIDRLVDINKQLTGARAQRLEAESLFRTVENKNYQDLAEIMKQGLVHQLKSNVANLEAERARLSTVFKPNHPRIQELSQQITSAQQAFNNEIAKAVQSIKSNYMASVAKERALQSEADKQQTDALNLRELGVDYTLLQEEVNANKSLYETLLKRLSETNIARDLAVSNMQIAERAAKPLRASGPNVSLFLLASMVSGLFLGVGVAFLREFVDSTVGTPEDVWRSVGLSTLGVVPHLKFLDRQSYGAQNKHARREQTSLPARSREPAKELIISHSPLSIISESYRTIRTSLLLSQAEKPPQVILITSPSPGEGKTATGLNLAIALAQDGHAVLLVDADMRKGLCHYRLGLRNHRGLSNVLTGGLSLKEGIQQTPVTGLSLLSRGVTPPNPSELLGSRTMTGIMNELRQKFEFILIDSPPVIAISDAAILSVVADGVLLVFNGQTTSIAYAQKAVERLDTVRARLLGVILNAVNLNDPHYSYYRSYSTYYQYPNGNESLSEAREGRMKDPDEPVARLSKVLEVVQATTTAKEDLNGDAGVKSNGHRESDNGTNRQDSSPSVSDAGKNGRFESAAAGTANLDKSGDNRRTQSGRLVPRDFMTRLINVLMESMGPVAPLVVRDHIAKLGESQDAFPKHRIDELVELIAPEILHSELRLHFQRRILEEFRDLERN